MSATYRCKDCRAAFPRSQFGSYSNGRRHDICLECRDAAISNKGRTQRQKEDEAQKSDAFELLQWTMRAWRGHAQE